MVGIAEVQKYDPVLGTALMAITDAMRNDQYIDFSLMIRRVVDALREGREEAKRAVGELKHLIVDEYQDVNPSQEALISELHKLGGKFFVVGDDDQAIYGWRGADVSRILTFRNRYPASAIHTLPKNFRSTPAIVEAADGFIAAELGAKRVTKNPQADPPISPRDFRKVWFDARPQEAVWVADRIQALLGTRYQEKDGTVRGLTPADFAILLRSTRMEEQDGTPRHSAFTEQLDVRGISYSLEAGGGVFDRPQVQALVGTFSLIRNSNPQREVVENFFNLNIQPYFPNADLNRVAFTIADWGRRVHSPPGLRQRLFPQEFLYSLLDTLGLQSSNFDSGTMRDIGLFSRILQDVETVYLSIDSPQRFSEILNFMDNVAETGYDTSTQDVLRRPDAVTVSTVHRMKGLEFPVVFVVDVESQRFPKKRAGYDGWLPGQIIGAAVNRGAYTSNADEEARLFYAAITRAERYLYVTGSANLPGGKRARNPSTYFQRVQHKELSIDKLSLPAGVTQEPQRRRVDETVVPTSFSEIHYFLRCPKD
jgi:DNA helicase-2/ATP-dependent DNA helicase PcrA